MSISIEAAVRQALARHAHLSADASGVAADANLYEAGMTSHASVNVMVALEDAFGIEFPTRMLTRDVFSTVASISSALQLLGVA